MCSTCNPTNRKLGLYSPLLVPSHPWESISMDFVRGLPLSKRGHDYMYAVVDSFRNICILMPCKKKINAEQTAHLFFYHVWVHFGLPTSIILNRDSCFLRQFWTSLCRIMDTKMKISISFHPQTNKKIEVVNITVVHLLQGYCTKRPKSWDDHLLYI